MVNVTTDKCYRNDDSAARYSCRGADALGGIEPYGAEQGLFGDRVRRVRLHCVLRSLRVIRNTASYSPLPVLVT